MATTFNFPNLTDTDWAPALRDAIGLYQKNLLDNATADALGIMIANLARWSINDAVKKNLLYRQHRDDEDFRSEIITEVYAKLNKVDTTQHEKRVLGLLKTIADHAIVNQIRYSSRLKRIHEDVSLDDVTLSCDLYGEREPL